MYELRRSNCRRIAVRLAALGIILQWVSSSATMALGQADPPDIRFSVVRTSSGGVHAYVPERWGILRINLVNNLDQPRELMCATYFDGEPMLQYGRRVWLPAKSMFHASQPVLLPKSRSPEERTINFRSLVLDAHASSEVLHKDDAGRMLHDSAILITQNSQITGLIDELNVSNDAPPDDAYELIVACRVDQDLGRQVAHLSDLFIADDEYSLDALDHLIVANDRLADDAAALVAIRRWLYGGGRLWVMLDRTDPRVLERLLGDAIHCHVVDRVSLTSVAIDPATSSISEKASPTDYEVPVDLVRASVSNVDITHTVNGWPAAFWKTCGTGRLLVTTLGARGWMGARSSNEVQAELRDSGRRSGQIRRDPQNDTAFLPRAEMSKLAVDLFTKRPNELLQAADIEPQVAGYVGYTIPARGLIIGLLIAFLALLITTGYGLQRAARLEHLGWVGPLLAVVASITLIVIGQSNRREIPDTAASVQLIQAVPGTNDVLSEGVVAAYHREGSQTPIRTSRGGRLVPDMNGLEGTVRRLVWNDAESWSWENVPQSAGLRSALFSQAGTTEQRVEAQASFDADGLSGTYSGIRGGADALLATRDGRIGVELSDDGTFVARVGSIFSEGQFLAAGLLTDEQDRRRRTLEKLLANKQQTEFPTRPSLLIWTDQWQTGFEFGENLRSQHAALVAIPLTLDRPPTGREFVIPAPLLSFRSITSPDGTPPSAMWNNLRHEWQERADVSSTWFRFQIPREVLPASATRGRLVIQVVGPVGRLEVLGLRREEVKTIQTFVDPVGTLTLDIADAELLRIASHGTLALGLKAGDASRPELTHTKTDLGEKVNYWRIESLSLQLWAKTIDPSTED